MHPSRSRFVHFLTSLLLGLVLSAVCGMARLQAATFTVNNDNDAGAGSLRQAMLDSEANAGTDTILFDPVFFSTPRTINLAGALPGITQSLTITGPGANLLTVRRDTGGNYPIFQVNSFNAPVIIDVAISGLTISNGNATVGGGVDAFRTNLMLTDCVIIGNQAILGGAGVFLDGGGTILRCTISGNTAGNQGGGINYQGNYFPNQTLRVVNSTISGNTANGGGDGGGIAFAVFSGRSRLEVISCTIANNTYTTNSVSPSGGIDVEATTGNTATLVIQSSIVANTAPNLSTIGQGGTSTVISQGFNLASDNGSGVLNQPTDQLNTNPLLGPLANNGGPTPTHALLPGSPALDKGNSFGLTTDQRGFARTVDFPSVANAAGGDGTDIGAFEFLDNTNVRVSDTKAGSVLVFPYYTSTIGGASDTRLTISNIGTGAQNIVGGNLVVDPVTNAYVHLFLIDGATCQQADLFLCLTPNASFSFKASDYDPGNTGYVIAVAVNNQGVPIRNNVLIGNAFVNTPDFADNYGAEAFWANSATVAAVNGNTATLFFDGIGYDAVPNQFAVEIQSPIDAPGQQIVTASLSGSLVTSTLTGAAQVGTGLVYNGNEKPFGSYNNWLTGNCQARATISTTSPRVPNGMAVMVPSGQTGTLKFTVGAAVGLLLTPRTATWKGIRTLHKIQTVATTLTIPIFVPVC